jgi:hypothetical protein
MTFAKATSRLRGDRFRQLREHPYSPLHVRPIEDNGKLIGYEHVSKEHGEHDGWVSDLVSPKTMTKLQWEGQKRILLQGTPWDTFDRDCCMLLENCFFARGQGIEFNEKALGILRQAQPEASGIDRYAVFGRTASGQANGLRGTFLEITGNLADCFIAWLKDRARKTAKNQPSDGNGPAKTHCN